MEITAGGIMMEIKIGGVIKSNCQVKFTGGKHNHLDLIKREDIIDLQAISKENVIDFLAVPFTVSGEDPMNVRELLGPTGKDIKILSKIDTLDGI